ncbi:hypothetical protein MKD41_13100 [Lutibacter sp. A64]|uniref:hypothetical protein n=1 Tax=Lutibacter sp. A64 TaxID=2918526 RepID=UPI001F070067|nr:hypothetical protein [Lutibacter sp. A64]UMB53265.1 hypothetical protein MKD41_13100 [Lutibacter sp. A64]
MKKDVKLTREQLQKIEAYLNNNDIKYIDLHLEVLDHISTDIESEMTENNTSFENAFDEVKLKWRKTFSYKWTFWLGISNGGSKLFIDHCLKIYKPLWFKCILGIVAFIAVFYGAVTIFNIDLDANYLLFKITFLLIALFFPVLLIYWKYQLKKIKLASTYSYLYNKQVFPNIFIVILFVIQIIDNEKFSDFTFVYLVTLFSLIIMGYSFYKNHLKVVSNYKKYQLQ